MYCVEASESVTMVIEKATPATVIIELAMAVSMPRAPSAPALSRGCQLFAASVSAPVLRERFLRRGGVVRVTGRAGEALHRRAGAEVIQSILANAARTAQAFRRSFRIVMLPLGASAVFAR